MLYININSECNAFYQLHYFALFCIDTYLISTLRKSELYNIHFYLLKLSVLPRVHLQMRGNSNENSKDILQSDEIAPKKYLNEKPKEFSMNISNIISIIINSLGLNQRSRKIEQGMKPRKTPCIYSSSV